MFGFKDLIIKPIIRIHPYNRFIKNAVCKYSGCIVADNNMQTKSYI